MSNQCFSIFIHSVILVFSFFTFCGSALFFSFRVTTNAMQSTRYSFLHLTLALLHSFTFEIRRVVIGCVPLLVNRIALVCSVIAEKRRAHPSVNE